jgi:hypothetical protein
MENNIYIQLNFIQEHLNAPKNQKNTFGGYQFRSAEDILEALKPHLAQTGCVLTLTDEVVFIEGRFYVRSTATLINANGQAIQCSAFAREEDSKKGYDAAQLTGATSSYARKIALNGLFAIDDNKDFDATNKGEDKKTKKGETKQEPLSNEDDAILQDAIQAAKDAKTASELTKVWKDFKPKFEHNEAFVNAIKSNPNHPSHKK